MSHRTQSDRRTKSARGRGNPGTAATLSGKVRIRKGAFKEAVTGQNPKTGPFRWPGRESTPDREAALMRPRFHGKPVA